MPNPTFNPDCAKARSRLILRRVYHDLHTFFARPICIDSIIERYEMKKRIIVSLIAVVALSGCATTASQTDISEVLINKNGGIVIVGVDAKNVGPVDLVGKLMEKRHSIDIHTAKDDGSTVSLSLQWATPDSGIVQDGYAILHLPENRDQESYVISRYNSSNNYLTLLCKGRETLTFKVKNGEVLYLGNYSIKLLSRLYNTVQWTVSRSSDFDAAKTYVSKLFPDIANEMKTAILQPRIPDDGADCN